MKTKFEIKIAANTLNYEIPQTVEDVDDILPEFNTLKKKKNIV